MPAAIVWEVREGKVVRAREYMDTWAAMSAVYLVALPAVAMP
jgi:ketosteroid isomerase-like protein